MLVIHTHLQHITQVKQYYTAPTLIRSLLSSGNEHVKAHDRSSLRILGTVGEPINPEAWKWYSEVRSVRLSGAVVAWALTCSGIK